MAELPAAPPASPASEPVCYVAITRDVLSLDECGAINTFSGVTRNNFEGKAVTRLEYDAYEPMALKELEKLCRAALDGSCGKGVRHVACVHRLGVVPNGEASVFILFLPSIARQDSSLASSSSMNSRQRC